VGIQLDHSAEQSAIPLLTQFALKVVGAAAPWLIGRRLIRFAVAMLVRTLKYPFDQTVAGYIGTATSVLLNIALIVAILGFFGIETTTFAASPSGVSPGSSTQASSRSRLKTGTGRRNPLSVSRPTSSSSIRSSGLPNQGTFA
jgi:hypothetical protein